MPQLERSHDGIRKPFQVYAFCRIVIRTDDAARYLQTLYLAHDPRLEHNRCGDTSVADHHVGMAGVHVGCEDKAPRAVIGIAIGLVVVVMLLEVFYPLN